MWQSSQFRLVGVVLAIPCAALFSGVGTARAASLTVDPVAVVEGESLVVSGEEWIGDVAIVFVKGNTAIQAGSAPSGPNGGPISITVVAPPESGAWQVCASGTNRLDMQPVSMCAPLDVTPPAPTPPATNSAPTTNSPSTTNSMPPTDTEPNSTAPPASLVPSESSPGESSSTSSVALAPPGVPGLPDGISEVDEDGASADGSGLSGLAIGIAAGIVAVTGLAIVGLVSSNASHRPRRSTLVGIGLAGAVLAGATAIAMPPPKLNVPKLSIVRVQTSESIAKNSSKTITANCPAGTVVIGGGWSSNWSSTRVDDVAPLVAWMEKQPNYVIVPPATLNSLEKYGSLESDAVFDRNLYLNVRREYWEHARTDATVHLSDTVWPAPYNNYLSAREQNEWIIRAEADSEEGRPVIPRPEVSGVPWSEEIRQAFVREYYTTFDRLGTYFLRSRFVGALVTESVPFEQGWRVKLTNPTWSLQSVLDAQVVALCAPLAASTNDPGVLGVTLRSRSGPWDLLSMCSTNEVLTSMGFASEDMRGIASMLPYEGPSAALFKGMSEKPSTFVMVCVRKDGLETTSATASTVVGGGYDDGTSAVCPAGFTVTGGGMDFDYRELGSSSTPSAVAVSTAIPTGSKTFSVVIRSPEIAWPQSASGPPLLRVGSVSMHAHTDYSKVDRTDMTVQALCARRVFTPA